MRVRQALSGVFLLVSVIVSAGLSACSAPDPGAFDIVPRKGLAGAPGLPTGSPTGGGGGGGGGVDGGNPEGGGGGTTSLVFDKPYTQANGETTAIGARHAGAGPKTIEDARMTDCTMTCHRAGGTAPPFLIAGVAAKPNIEVGVKLSTGTVRVARTAADGHFYIPVGSGDAIANAKTSARDGTRESAMNTPITSGGCNQGACHGDLMNRGLPFKP